MMKLGSKTRVDRQRLNQVMRDAPQKIINLLDATAFEGEGYAKRSMGLSVSKPGDPPGVVTGQLRASIQVIRTGEFSRSVISDKDYAPHLEFGTRHMQARPFFAPMAYYLEQQIPSLWARFGIL